jgi:hypothetical protein
MRLDVRTLYRKLLTLYPRSFKEELGEPMEQTFNDLYRERQKDRGLPGFVFWMFVETCVGFIREHALVWAQGDSLKAFLTKPTSAAFVGIILSLPLGLTFLAFMFDIEPLVKLLNNLFTMEGQQGQINMLGRIVIFGGLLILPFAFVLNLRPLLKKGGTEGKRRLYTLNLVVGVAILLLILFAWGGLILEEIYCLQGIRCD